VSKAIIANERGRWQRPQRLGNPRIAIGTCSGGVGFATNIARLVSTDTAPKLSDGKRAVGPNYPVESVPI